MLGILEVYVMNILFISEYFYPKVMGGGEINLFLLAKHLSEKGIKVFVLTSYFRGLKRREKVSGITVLRRLKTSPSVSGLVSNWIRGFFFPRSVTKEIRKITKEIDIDIIHFIGQSIIASDICSSIKKRCVATIESYIALCPKGDLLYKGKHVCYRNCNFHSFVSCLISSNEIGKLRNRFYLRFNPLLWLYIYLHNRRLKSALKNCRLIAISGFVKKRLASLGLDSTVIPNIVETGRFYSKESSDKKIKIIYLGSLTVYKGPQILLEAAKGLSCRIELYGEGNLKDKLQKIIEKNGLDAEVKSPVSYEDIPEIYSKADIIVFPSLWPEPFGRIAVEAMASSKPVIASDIGGITETLGDNGILIEPGNVDQMKKAIIKLINDEKIRQKMGRQGTPISAKYSKEIIIKRLIDFYKKNG
jgi:glycosyltransferase involved in cell wall biosynthesis